MGDIQEHQPLTQYDRVTVIIYRSGILLSAVMVACLAAAGVIFNDLQQAMRPSGFLLYTLFVAVGLSVMYIHLYVSRFHRVLKRLYIGAAACVGVLSYLGHGNPAAGIFGAWYGPALLLPLSGCLGFITAKEAFCFRLIEGYVLAVLMPGYLLLATAKALSPGAILGGLVLIAAMLLFFTARKIFMPLHYDIGDKSAYQ